MQDEQAFIELTELLTSGTTFTHELHADSVSIELRAIRYQFQHGEKRVIGFANRLLIKAGSLMGPSPTSLRVICIFIVITDNSHLTSSPPHN